MVDLGLCSADYQSSPWVRQHHHPGPGSRPGGFWSLWDLAVGDVPARYLLPGRLNAALVQKNQDISPYTDQANYCYTDRQTTSMEECAAMKKLVA